MLFLKSDINKLKKTAGMHHTESQSGDAPKPLFSIKTNKTYENPEIRVRSTIEIGPDF